jgi:broad specificity phosphatase PhoE
MQTIFPYAKKNNLNLKLEYGLSEYHHEDIISKQSVGVELPEYISKKYNTDCTYNSIISHAGINYPENIKDAEIRTKKILYNIIKNHHNTQDNVIIVTHQTICYIILNIISNSKTLANPPTIDNYILHNYPRGKLSLIYDNGWNFSSLN